MEIANDRANIKIPRIDYAYLDRAAAEDGIASPTAYIRGLIHADRIARARAEAARMLTNLTATLGDSDDQAEQLITETVRLYRTLTGHAPRLNNGGTDPYTIAHAALAQLAARILLDVADHEHVSGSQAPTTAFIDALAADGRISVENLREYTAAAANVMHALVDKVAEHHEKLTATRKDGN